MLPTYFNIVSAFLNLLAGAFYARDALNGDAKPNRVTWLLWGSIPIIAFAAEREQGIGLVSLMTLTVGLGPLLVFVASYFNRNAYWKISQLDMVCAAISIIAIVIWLSIDAPNLAILLSLVADIFAALPTVIKAYHHPKTESATPYLLFSIGAIVTMLTLTRFDVANAAYPVYILTIYSVLFLLTGFRLGRKVKIS